MPSLAWVGMCPSLMRPQKWRVVPPVFCLVVLPFYPIMGDMVWYVFFPFPVVCTIWQIWHFQYFSPDLSGLQEGLCNNLQTHAPTGWSPWWLPDQAQKMILAIV